MEREEPFLSADYRQGNSCASALQKPVRGAHLVNCQRVGPILAPTVELIETPEILLQRMPGM